MRSKQQPRPSYRWLNKDENDGNGTETMENVEENKEDIKEKSTDSSKDSSKPSSPLLLLSDTENVKSVISTSSPIATSKQYQTKPDQAIDTTTEKNISLSCISQQTFTSTRQNERNTTTNRKKALSSKSSSLTQSILVTNINKNESPSASPPLPPRHIISIPTTNTSTSRDCYSPSRSNSTTSNKLSPTDEKLVKVDDIDIEHKITSNVNQKHHHQEQQRSTKCTEILPPPAKLLRSLRNQRSSRNNTPKIMNVLDDHSSALTDVPLSSYSTSDKTESTSAIAVTKTKASSSNNNLIDSYHDSSSSSTNTNHQDHHPSAECELTSPRCQSRESSGSGGRCQSDDSNCSGSTAAPTPISPVGISLPSTLQPSSAATLLPPQSAAMAAYFNVAAVAAQQNRLLLTNPLAASLVHQAATGQSPSNLPLQSPIHPDDSSILDFSTKRLRRDSDTDNKSDTDAVNLSKSNVNASDNSPLDLSVGGRKRISEPDMQQQMLRKMPRHQEYKSVPSPWVTPMTPYLAAVAAANISPKSHLSVDWNGKTKLPINDASKALEKMSEMTRLSGSTDNDVPIRSSNNHSNNSSSANNTSSGNSGRHSAWQSHWLNKGADTAKDVFKCVWCKLSFPTLASLTTHMKETQHCGVSVPPTGNISSQIQSNQQTNQHHHHHHHQSPSSTSSNSSSNKSDLNLLIKETMPLPRKLVRGQDVWLGKGAEQTRQILKCMWCGQSFRSLAEMTSHMQQTQHYTNIISQEQIISWKSSEEAKSSSASGSTGNSSSGMNTSNNSGGANNASTNSTVSAVLTCKVCDQAFSSLKDLSNHMVKNSHYKEHIMRSITESGGRRRQTREKRKKSLPVRKLLELERAQHDFKNGDVKSVRSNIGNHNDLGSTTRITCEKCGDKIETVMFVEHIRQCVGGTLIPNSPRNNLIKTPLSLSNNIIPPDSPLTTNCHDGSKSTGDESPSPASTKRISPHTNDLISQLSSKDSSGNDGGEKSSPSVLNAIEQLIEKSFDTRSRHNNSGFTTNTHGNAPLGSSILKRLGIDESVDYTKPLIDAQTMNLLRSYQQSQYSKRERSGSESSSVSDRGSSHLESSTPERKPDINSHNSPTQTPDKLSIYSHSEHEDDKDLMKIKREPIDEDDSESESEMGEKLTQHRTKKELNMDDMKDNDNAGEMDIPTKIKDSTSSIHSTQMQLNVAASTPAASPASDRSTTPRSSNNSIGSSEKKICGSSLNALSSMFNNLTGSVNSVTNANLDLDNAGHLSGSSQSKKGNAHPLAALQKLCDKTENNPPQQRSVSTGALAANCPPTTNISSSNILAFSWACNDAIMTSDSIIKCAFCDTPFCSKGAYRHHLSKVHFVKDESIDPAGMSMKSPSERAPSTESSKNLSNRRPHSRSQSPAKVSSNNNNNALSQLQTGNSKSPSPSQSSLTNAANSSAGTQGSFDESPHSKFLKYTELAKQLSSKYV